MQSCCNWFIKHCRLRIQVVWRCTTPWHLLTPGKRLFSSSSNIKKKKKVKKQNNSKAVRKSYWLTSKGKICYYNNIYMYKIKIMLQCHRCLLSMLWQVHYINSQRIMHSVLIFSTCQMNRMGWCTPCPLCNLRFLCAAHVQDVFVRPTNCSPYLPAAHVFSLSLLEWYNTNKHHCVSWPHQYTMHCSIRQLWMNRSKWYEV